MTDKGFERRMAVDGLELRDEATGPVLSGKASTFNRFYDMGWYKEKVDPAAFSRTLGRKPDVRLLVNHDGLPLARTISGTLTLESDEKGLNYRAPLDPNDPDVQALIPKMRRGDLSGSSFSFRVFPHGDLWNQDLSERTLMDLDLHNGDVSVVTYPANPTAPASLRSAGLSPIDAMRSAISALETRQAPTESMVSVLTRALAYFHSIDLIADEALEDVSEALGIENPEDESDDMPMMSMDPMTSGANSAAIHKELRARILALAE